MIFNTSKSFKNELESFYKKLSITKNISTWGFTKQRLKFNPEALVAIIKDYLKYFYEQSDVKKQLKGCYFSS